MKTENLLLIGLVGLGAYWLIKDKGFLNNGYTNLDTSGYFGASGNKAQPATTIITQPATSLYNPIIFSKTSATSPQRFVVDEFSGGGGVQDRYAQQTITTAEADKRRELSYYKDVFISTAAPKTNKINALNILNQQRNKAGLKYLI